MRISSWRIGAGGLVSLLLLALPLPAQLLNSWEGSLEGWAPQNGALLANSGGTIGVTEGSDSLSVTVPNEGFLRYGARQLDASALSLVTAAAANPLLHRFEFDVTYDVSQIPQGSVT